MHSSLYRQGTPAPYILVDFVNPYKFQTAKIFDKGEDDRDVRAGRCRITGINM